MFLCVQLQAFRHCDPRIKTPPLVDLAVLLQAAQSESESAVRSVPVPCYLNSNTILGTVIRYLANLRSFFMCTIVGCAIPLQISFAAY